MGLVDRKQLATMLAFVLKRMRHSDAEAFSRPVPASLVPEYYDIIFHPLDLSTLERKVKLWEYASTTALLEDAKWILHNCIIFNGTSTKYCQDAKLIMKICRHELCEIELCPDCYQSSVARKDAWFTQPCRFPHCLVWAKLKGFPFWPAKALRISPDRRLVDVRFFGAHDRAWIPVANCFLLSALPPAPAKNVRKHGLDSSLDELSEHVRLLKIALPEFHYAPPKAPLQPEHLDDGLCPLFVAAAAEKLCKAVAETPKTDESAEDSEVSETPTTARLGPPSPVSSLGGQSQSPAPVKEEPKANGHPARDDSASRDASSTADGCGSDLVMLVADAVQTPVVDI